MHCFRRFLFRFTHAVPWLCGRAACLRHGPSAERSEQLAQSSASLLASVHVRRPGLVFLLPVALAFAKLRPYCFRPSNFCNDGLWHRIRFSYLRLAFVSFCGTDIPALPDSERAAAAALCAALRVDQRASVCVSGVLRTAWAIPATGSDRGGRRQDCPF